jgi:hypothetical protein
MFDGLSVKFTFDSIAVSRIASLLVETIEKDEECRLIPHLQVPGHFNALPEGHVRNISRPFNE